jgi:hypothetical protein
MRIRRPGLAHAVTAALVLFLAGLAVSSSLLFAGVADAAAPTRILQSWPGDAATSRAVTWRTLGTMPSAQAQIGPAPVENSPVGALVTVAGISRTISLIGGKRVVHHRVDFAG